MQFEECGADFAFFCGNVDARLGKKYNANHYYYAGAYEQGYEFSKLEIKLVQNKIDRLNKELDKANQQESFRLASNIEMMRELAIMELNKVKGK